MFEDTALEAHTVTRILLVKYDSSD